MLPVGMNVLVGASSTWGPLAPGGPRIAVSAPHLASRDSARPTGTLGWFMEMVLPEEVEKTSAVACATRPGRPHESPQSGSLLGTGEAERGLGSGAPCTGGRGSPEVWGPLVTAGSPRPCPGASRMWLLAVTPRVPPSPTPPARAKSQNQGAVKGPCLRIPTSSSVSGETGQSNTGDSARTGQGRAGTDGELEHCSSSLSPQLPLLSARTPGFTFHSASF